MSRIGNKAITVPAGVEVIVNPGNEVTVKGPKGTLSRQFNPALGIELNEQVLTVSRSNEQKHTKQLHGTTRALLFNMIEGVSNGDGDEYWDGGKILDPNNGKTYSVRLSPIDNGRKLQVRGYIGPFFRTQVWERVD